MENMAVAYSLVPYVRDVLIGLLPLVCLCEALRASFPFRAHALLWYIGLVGAVLLVIYGGVPAFVSPWTVHSPLTVIGYLVGMYWCFRPRRRPTVVEAAVFQDSYGGGFRSQGNRRAERPTLPEWW